MFKHTYVAKVGFVNHLDRVCPTHGGLFSSQQRNTCPKCNAALAPRMVTTKKGTYPSIMTEVVLYPILPQSEKDEHSARTKAASGFEFEIRMNLWGYYDEQRQVACINKRAMYIVPKRTLYLEFNQQPVVRPYVTREGQHKLEFKYTVSGRDEVRFMDSKATYEALTGGDAGIQPQASPAAQSNPAPSTPVSANNTNDTGAPNMDAIMAQLASLTAAVAQLKGNTPAPAAMNANNSVADNPDPSQFSNDAPPSDMDMNDDGIGTIDPFSA